MRSYIYFFIFTIVFSVVSATSIKDVISFNTNITVGYEGILDEKTRNVEMNTPIKAKVSKKGISASGKICGFRLWSNSSHGKKLPFIVRQSGDVAVLSGKQGADLHAVKNTYKFFIQAFDCDPIRHSSVKVPVLLHLIPNERPLWSANAYSFNVAEDKPSGTFVGKIQATSSNSKMCKYTIQRPQDAPFDVDGNGAIYTRKELHVSEVSNYILRVQADDCWRPKRRSSVVSVNIRVTAVCRPGWHGVFRQLNYRVGSGAQRMFDELALTTSCGATPAPGRIHMELRLEPGDRTACPRSDGCPLSPGERLQGGEKSGGPRVSFTANTSAEAIARMGKALVYLNSDIEPTPSKRRVVVATSLGGKTRLDDAEVVIVLLPRPVPLLHPNVAGGRTSAAKTVAESVLAGPGGYPVLHDLRMVLKEEKIVGKREPSVDFCVLRIHPKLTPVAYLQWPKEAVHAANLKALNTSTQLNLKGVAPASVYRRILRRVRYHHAYPYALNSSSFVLVCRELNSGADAADSSMLVLKLRIQHDAQRPHREVQTQPHEPPAAVMVARPRLSVPEVGPPKAHAQSAVRHHRQEAAPVTDGGRWSTGAVVGFVLGLIFLALATYLAVMRVRRYRAAVPGGPGEMGDGAMEPRLGRVRGDSAERSNNGVLEMEWDNSELNITVNPMEESFTKYSQVVHYREFSSDEDGEDDEDLSSLLSGIPEEGEEESARSCGSGSYGGAGVGICGGHGVDDQDWQWEDDMLPAYTHRPSPLGTANAHV